MSTGCLVNVTRCSDPDPYFKEALRSANAVAGKSGPADRLHVVAYDSDERKLVRVSLPLNWIGRFGDLNVDLDLDDFNGICDRDSDACRDARRKLRRFRSSDLGRLPLGPIVEVNDEDGERVLVYLR
jgi:hypothetical protein